jgi:hypothetical protein
MGAASLSDAREYKQPEGADQLHVGGIELDASMVAPSLICSRFGVVLYKCGNYSSHHVGLGQNTWHGLNL